MVHSRRQAIDYERDFDYDYFGFKTLERSYLLKRPSDKSCIERPQHMIMRVAVGIHGYDVDAAIETWECSWSVCVGLRLGLWSDMI